MTVLLRSMACGLLLCATVYAQTSPALMLRPWQTHQQVEFNQDLMFLNNTHTDTGIHSRLNIYETTARARLDPSAEQSLSFGFQQTYIDTAIHGPGIDEDILIQSFAVGLPISQWNGWQLDMTAGLGYAGNDAWTDGMAWYGLASLTATRELGPDRSVTCLLSYNGNSTIFPDLPLPGFYYSHTLNESFRYSVGLPYSSIAWKPIDKLTVDLTYLFPTTVNATVSYALPYHLTVFGAYDSRVFAYHLNPQRKNDRTFLEQDRLEAGLRWNRGENLSVTLAGGYAFRQQISSGFDLRAQNDTVDLSDKPYLRVGFDIHF